MVETEDGNSEDLSFISPEQTTECNINPDLPTGKADEIRALIDLYPDVFSDIAGKTETVVHDIKLTSNVPVHRKPYPIPSHLKQVVEDEVENMIQMGIIEPSSSPYCSPIVLVNKEDGNYRLCIYFRALNDVTVFDAEPMPNREDSLSEFVGDQYFSELDLCKGYWQISLSPESKIYTAFATSQGLMQFTRMPF